MIVTIDGPSGTGKTTIARALAKELEFTYFDTGAMYRSVAFLLVKAKIDWQNPENLHKFLADFSFVIKKERYIANGEDVTEAIRTQEVSKFTSQISCLEAIRNEMVALQRRLGQNASAVFEGRDMGTVVFPQAEKKFFLTATVKERARRRYQELVLKKVVTDFETVLHEVEERDYLDSTRELSPLKMAKDAILIDTTKMDIEEVTQQLLTIVRNLW